MSNDLVAYIEAAVESGAVPGPIDGESVDSFRFRVAHAGAVVGAKWVTDRNVALAAQAKQRQDEADGEVAGVGEAAELEVVD